MLRSCPYRDLTVETVMASAGLSRTIFYRHFQDMPDLVTEVLRQLGDRVDRHTIESVRSPDMQPTEEWFRTILDPVVGFFVEHGPLIRNVADAAGVDDRLREAYESIMRYFTAATAEGIGRLAESGRVDGVGVDALSMALNALNERYMLRAFGTQPQEDPKVVTEALVLIWTRTLRIS